MIKGYDFLKSNTQNSNADFTAEGLQIDLLAVMGLK
jgi:hypothetical protein